MADAEALAETFDVGIFELELPDGSGLHLAARMSGFGRLHARIFTTRSLTGTAARRAAPMGVVLSHDAPTKVLLDAVADALASRETSGQLTRSGVRPSVPVEAWPFVSTGAGVKRS
jgi:DNA-binding NarL/FixJ family response regulator